MPNSEPWPHRALRPDLVPKAKILVGLATGTTTLSPHKKWPGVVRVSGKDGQFLIQYADWAILQPLFHPDPFRMSRELFTLMYAEGGDREFVPKVVTFINANFSDYPAPP